MAICDGNMRPTIPQSYRADHCVRADSDGSELKTFRRRGNVVGVGVHEEAAGGDRSWTGCWKGGNDFRGDGALYLCVYAILC